MKRSERGFTLIEMIVATAIVALIGGAAGMAIFQVITGTERNNNHMTAVRQVQNAGYWISQDTLAAQSIVTGDAPETSEYEFIILGWTNWGNGDVHQIIYTLDDMADGLKKLKRQHLIHDAEGVETGNEMTLVAEYVDSASFSEQGSTWKLTIQTRSGDETETREYGIKPRVNI